MVGDRGMIKALGQAAPGEANSRYVSALTDPQVRTLPQAEDAFRISKSDLNLRPVFHRKTERVEAHILVCFLTLELWWTLEMWMRGKGLGNCARQLLKEVATLRSLDVVLPVKEPESEQTREVRLRVVARPDRPVAELLVRLGLDLPSAPKLVQNGVEKNAV